ncbi:MAG: hypothetical protein ACXWQE_04820 [Bdellovibrionales bacterium]
MAVFLAALVGGCSSQQMKDQVEREPATEFAKGGATAAGGDLADYGNRGQRNGVGSWSTVGAEEFSASRQRGRGRRAGGQVEESNYNLFGSPFGGASEAPSGRGRGGRRSCPGLSSRIAAYTSQVACYESLFAAESSCSTTVVHNQRATHNPHAGVGLCALETSPAVRAQKRRGPACDDIGSTDGQIRCCIHLMQITNGRFFGTVIHHKTPRCS